MSTLESFLLHSDYITLNPMSDTHAVPVGADKLLAYQVTLF